MELLLSGKPVSAERAKVIVTATARLISAVRGLGHR
jgi:hypothetical protein